MRRPLCTVLVSFVLVTSLLEAQESKSQSSETRARSTVGDEAQVMSLLQQSHDINQQLPVSARFYLLTQQAQLASQMRVDLGRAWANELFTLSFQGNGDERSTTQESAMGILARLDPDRALVLLHSMSMEEPETYRTTSPPKIQLVQRVFEILSARDGISAIPLLEQEAALLGAEGHYPYGALGFAAMRAVSKEWPNDRPRALEGVQSVFERAFARYSQSGHGYFDDCEFGNMLQVVAGYLPGESVRPGLRRLVKNLLETDTNKYRFHAEVRTSDGKSARVNNAIDAAILHFGALINRLDPELAEQLKSTRPELQPALDYAKDGRQSMGKFGVEPKNVRPPDPSGERGADALIFSHINPEVAIAKAEQLPDDDKRASTMLAIARAIAGDYPERAAELIIEIQRRNKPIDDEMQLNLISAQASVAAAQDKKNELHELLQRGLEAANHIIREQQRTDSLHFVDGVASLVQIGIQNDPNLTISFLQSLSPSDTKAALLLEAAWALSKRQSIPVG
jgi:hypothetical protein